MADNDYEEGLENSQMSKINSGMLIVLRLNDLWKDSHKHARAGQYAKWNDDLDRVWCELASDEKPLTAKEKKAGGLTAQEEYDKWTLAYATACKDVKKATGFKKPEEGSKVSMVAQKTALIKKEIFLRRMQNIQGKGTAYHDNSEDYMD